MSVNSTCFHVKMVKDMLKTPVTDDEALAIMGLLHLCPIEVSAGTLSDAPDVRLVEPITQRHAVQCIARCPFRKYTASPWGPWWVGSCPRRRESRG